jgi:hypothetical protein
MACPEQSCRVGTSYCGSPGFFALQLTILTLSALTTCPPLSILNCTSLIRKVQTSSQNLYVSSDPYSHYKRSSAIVRIREPEAGRGSQTQADGKALTLNVSLDLTLSCKASAIARSKFARIFIASCGSMRWSLIRSSSVSVSVTPML